MSTLLPGFTQYNNNEIIQVLDKAITDAKKRNRSEEVYNLEEVRSEILKLGVCEYLYHPETDEVYRIANEPQVLFALHGETDRRFILELTNVCINCITLVGLGQRCTSVLHVSVPDKVGEWRVINSMIELEQVQPDANFYVTKGIKYSLSQEATFAKCPDCEKYFLI